MTLRPWARWVFVATIAVLVAAAGLAAARADPPTDVPAYALDSATVWRVEILLATFAGGYMLVTAIWLAAQGRAFTKFTAAGVSFEAELALVEDATEHTIEAVELLEEQVAKLATALEER